MNIKKTGQPIFWKDILFKLTCRFNSTSKVPKGNIKLSCLEIDISYLRNTVEDLFRNS